MTMAETQRMATKGMLPTMPRPMNSAILSRLKIVRPPLMAKARPRAKTIIPRVAAKSTIFSLVMTRPLTKPSRVPMTSTVRKMYGVGKIRESLSTCPR